MLNMALEVARMKSKTLIGIGKIRMEREPGCSGAAKESAMPPITRYRPEDHFPGGMDGVSRGSLRRYPPVEEKTSWAWTASPTSRKR